MGNFVKAINKSDVPGKEGRVVQVAGQPVAVFNIGGEFCAVYNICPHQGGPLGEGDLEGTVVTCPWHGWQFDVKTGKSPINPAACIKTFPCRVEGNDVLVEV